MKVKQKLVITLIIGLLVIGFNPVTFAQEKVELVTNEWIPYTSSEMDNKRLCMEIVDATFENMDAEPKYNFLPWKRATKYVEMGRAWAVFPYAITEKRKQDFLFSEPIIDSDIKFFYYENGADIKYDKLSDLKSYKIGGVRGYFYEQKFNKAGLNVDYASAEKSALKKLKHGRVDLVPFDELPGWELIKKLYPNEVKKFGTLEKPLKTNSLALMVSKDSLEAKERLKKFNKSLQEIKNKKIYKKILKKYNIKN